MRTKIASPFTNLHLPLPPCLVLLLPHPPHIRIPRLDIMEVLFTINNSVMLAQPPVTTQLAGALILPIDGLPNEEEREERRLSMGESVHQAEAKPSEPPSSPSRRPTSPNMLHLVLCTNALAIGAVSATFKWAQRSLDGDEEACTSWGKEFVSESTSLAESITPFGGYVLRKHLFQAVGAE